MSTSFSHNSTSLYDVCQDVYIILWYIPIMNVAKIVGNNLKQARKFKGYTQKQVAERFKMTQQQYSRFENGIFELNYNQIIELCEFLDVTPNELFTID